MQSLQLALHERIGRPGGGAILPYPLPIPLRALLKVAIPPFRLVTAHVLGRGFRPEQISRELLGR
jgi:hypothetical protein